MGGGAWPYLVGGLVCLLNCDNERDLNLLNSSSRRFFSDAGVNFLEGLWQSMPWRFEANTGL